MQLVETYCGIVSSRLTVEETIEVGLCSSCALFHA